MCLWIDRPPSFCFFFFNPCSIWGWCGTFSSMQRARRAVAPRCSGGQLITQVWDLVTGHHHPALCCCQEPFTPSSSLPNGTSQSIKTIITANPTQSKEIILACRSKHGRGVWVYLSGDLLDMHSAGQGISVWILRICLVWMDGWLQEGFSPRSHKVWPSRWAFFLFGWKQKSMTADVGWSADPYQPPCFPSHHGLMNHSQHPLNISSAKTSIVSSEGQ